MTIVGSTGVLDYSALKAVADLVGWLKRSGLSLGDAESAIVEACRHGAARDEIARSVIERFDLSVEDADRVLDLAAILAFQGIIKRGEGGRYYATNRSDAEARVIALVSVPVSAWETVRPHVWHGRAAWLKD